MIGKSRPSPTLDSAGHSKLSGNTLATTNDNLLVFDEALVRRYDKAGPRYTSYPTAVQFHQSFTLSDYQRQVGLSNQVTPPRPLSLYFHIPFCATLCFYCACNKIITKRKEKAVEYLERLHREIERQGELFSPRRVVEQLHLGGGTPTFLSVIQIETLLDKVSRHFSLRRDEQRDFSIEVDPRTVDAAYLQALWDMGFNRISLGVQDFDAKVQQAVHRIQAQEDTLALIQAARRIGFRSINTDLIYGLPLQTLTSFSTTLDTIIDASPDRISLFNYAHLPERFSPQQRIKAEDLPSPDEKLAILQLSVDKLNAAGYVYIGMDHFAKPDDELSHARHVGTLYRNFQGYSTHSNCDLVGMGVTAIGQIHDCYAQNHRTLEDYYAAIDAGRLAVDKGYTLNLDDKIRRKVIENIMCYDRVEFSAIAELYGIDFKAYFCSELEQLQTMSQDGLLSLSDDSIQVLPPGRLLLRNICMTFDRYLPQAQQTAKFSRVI